MSKTPQEAISASQNDDTERRSDQRFASGYGGGKLVSRLTMQDLKLVQDAFTINQTGQERELSLDRNQFCEVMSIVLNKGTEEEYGDLFDKIDVTKEGFVDWDKFCSHMLLEYYEKDDRMKTTQVPQWRELKTLQSPHKDIIKRLSPLNNPSRYISISKEGVVCMWSLNMKLLRTVQIHTDQDEVKQRDLWVTDFVPMQNLYKFALALTSKEIAIYDLSSKSEFNCQFRVQGLQFTPLCMDYWNNPKNPNEAILVYGDVSGQVNALLFSAATIALFDRPSQHTSDTQDVYLNVDIQDVARGKYRNARIVQHHGHSEWTRQVAYSAHLDCFISCATTYKNALVLGWIEKAKMNMRITQFKVPQGVLAFDYNEKLNLIATAGVNHHVCLWNPYVVSKPVGVLRGHMQSVVAVQFIQNRGQLISLSKDKVLRIWDTHLQVCQQRLSGMFPKGPVEVSITMFYDEEHCKLFTAFNHQLTLMMMKAEVKDRIISHEQPVTAAIYNKKFNQVVSACSGSVITMWMVDTGQKVKQFANAHGNSEITALTQDTSEMRLFTGSADGTVKIWDFNGHCHHILMAGNGSPAEISQVLCLKRIILAVGWDRTLCVFRDGQINSFYVYPSEWKGRQEHQDDIISAAFCSPTTLATAGYDGDIVIWNLNSEQASRHLVSHSYIKSAGRTSRAKSRSRSRADTSSSPAKVQEDTKLSVPGTASNLSIDSAQSEPNSTSDQGDGGNAVTNLIFLTERPQSASNNGANLVYCNANGWVRFWNTQGSTIVGEFLAHEHAASLTMAVDDKNQVLVTGDADGSVKVWDMTEFSQRRKPENQAPPPLLKHFQPHTDVINSIELLTRNDRLLILTASSDCSVALWDTKGRQVGVFGQEEHWKMDLIAEEEKEVKESSEEESEVKISEEKEKLSDEEKNQLIEVSTDESYDPNFRVKTWGNTILGKAYRESRGEKRERRQPQTIPNLPYLVWEKTGQTPAGPYAALNTADLQSVKPIQKPDFISNPDKYFSGSAPSKKTGTKKLPSLPAITDQLQMRYDEKSLFPKHILDMDAKMKTAHALTLRGKRGSKFKGGRVSAASSPNRLKGLLGDAVAQAEKTKKAPNWNKMLINRSSQAGTKIDDVIYEV